MKKLFVFISGPYTKGDIAKNIRRAIAVADKVYQASHYPYIPHLDHFWHLLHPRPYEQWMDLDLAWLKKCDCLLRIKGESAGADREVATALKLDMPIFYGLKDFLNRTKAAERGASRRSRDESA